MPTDQLQPKPKLKLRWYQFSMRRILIGLLLLVCICGFFIVKRMIVVHKQKEAVAALEKLGARIEYDYQRFAGDSFNPEPESLVHGLARLAFGNDSTSDVIEVQFDRNATDADLHHLQGFEQLECLFLSYSKVTEDGLDNIKELKRIFSLALDGLPITDNGLRKINGLKQLAILSLMDTEITDEGLRQIGGMKQLNYLSLDDTKITDAGLKHLEALEKLKSLDLRSTKVTDAGVAKLQKALPNCRIVH